MITDYWFIIISLIVIFAFYLCLYHCFSKEKKNDDGIVKNKLDELYMLLEGLPIFRPIKKLSEPYVISIDDFAVKTVYIISYDPHRKEYILLACKTSDNSNNKAKDYETKLITKKANEILWYLEAKFDF